MSYKMIFEILEETRAKKKKDEKVKILKDNESWGLKDILRGTYDNTVQWLLPEGRPPFTPNLQQSTPSDLQKQNTQFQYFVKGGPGGSMPSFKREKIFLALLEAIHPNDAEVVISMIAKKPIKGVTRNVVEEAFPGLLLDST